MTKEHTTTMEIKNTVHRFDPSDIALIEASRLFDVEYYRFKTGYKDLSTKDLISTYLNEWCITEIEPNT